jgi:hypothetical protein
MRHCRRTFGSIRFLFTAPLILAFLFVINVVTSPGHWWVQWAALGLGIAWMLNLFRVFRTLLLVGGLAGLAAYLSRRGWQ